MMPLAGVSLLDYPDTDRDHRQRTKGFIAGPGMRLFRDELGWVHIYEDGQKPMGVPPHLVRRVDFLQPPPAEISPPPPDITEPISVLPVPEFLPEPETAPATPSALARELATPADAETEPAPPEPKAISQQQLVGSGYHRKGRRG